MQIYQVFVDTETDPVRQLLAGGIFFSKVVQRIHVEPRQNRSMKPRKHFQIALVLSRQKSSSSIVSMSSTGTITECKSLQFHTDRRTCCLSLRHCERRAALYQQCYGLQKQNTMPLLLGNKNRRSCVCKDFDCNRL